MKNLILNIKGIDMSGIEMSDKEMHSLKNYIRQGLFNVFYSIFKYIDFPFFNYIRFFILRLFGCKIKATYISDGITFWFPWNLEIGKKSSLNQGCNINAAGGIKIGNYVRIAAYTVINSVDHEYRDKNEKIYKQGYIKGRIVIEDDVWIGAGVIITRGVRIGQGSIIGAGSLVNKDIPPYSIAVGVPAEVKKKRE